MSVSGAFDERGSSLQRWQNSCQPIANACDSRRCLVPRRIGREGERFACAECFVLRALFGAVCRIGRRVPWLACFSNCRAWDDACHEETATAFAARLVGGDGGECIELIFGRSSGHSKTVGRDGLRAKCIVEDRLRVNIQHRCRRRWRDRSGSGWRRWCRCRFDG